MSETTEESQFHLVYDSILALPHAVDNAVIYWTTKDAKEFKAVRYFFAKLFGEEDLLYTSYIQAKFQQFLDWFSQERWNPDYGEVDETMPEGM